MRVSGRLFSRFEGADRKSQSILVAMSAFRRRQTVAPLPGTRPSPSGGPLLSTGLPSVDDLLGGGLPVSTLLLIESDFPTSYSDLLLKYWIAQGLESGQDVAVVAAGVDGGPDAIADMLMGIDGGGERKETKEEVEERENEERLKEKMKIAFRYEGMKQHQVSLDEAKSGPAGESDTYSSVFDLTTTRSLSSTDRQLLHLIDVDELPSTSSSSSSVYNTLYDRIEALINDGGFRHSTDPSASRKALRLALSNFGSPSWGPFSPSALFSFLHRLRSLLSVSNASCILTFPSHLYASASSSSSTSNLSSTAPSSPLLARLSHAVSSVLRLTSLSSSPALAALFPRHAGLLTFPKLPAPPSGGGLVPPGAKLSILRGLGGGGEGRDNLVGFRVKRRRFVVEVVSDDPLAGEEEAEKKKNARRKKVEEANRREREAQEGGEGNNATDVLLRKVGERVSSVRIGGEEHQQQEVRVDEPHQHSDACSHSHHADLPPPIPSVEPSSSSSAPPPRKSAFKKKVGVRMGGVSFGGGEGEGEKPKSVSSMLHSRPDLLDF